MNPFGFGFNNDGSIQVGPVTLPNPVQAVQRVGTAVADLTGLNGPSGGDYSYGGGGIGGGVGGIMPFSAGAWSPPIVNVQTPAGPGQLQGVVGAEEFRAFQMQVANALQQIIRALAIRPGSAVGGFGGMNPILLLELLDGGTLDIETLVLLGAFGGGGMGGGFSDPLTALVLLDRI